MIYEASELRSRNMAADVFLNGEEVKNVFSCEDGPKGWVEVLCRDEMGRPIVGFEAVTKILHGSVEVRLKELQ